MKKNHKEISYRMQIFETYTWQIIDIQYIQRIISQKEKDK